MAIFAYFGKIPQTFPQHGYLRAVSPFALHMGAVRVLSINKITFDIDTCFSNHTYLQMWVGTTPGNVCDLAYVILVVGVEAHSCKQTVCEFGMTDVFIFGNNA